mgnify:CR=1 FL=1
MATREKAAGIDFSDFLEEDAESQLKEAGACRRRLLQRTTLLRPAAAVAAAAGARPALSRLIY